MQSLCCCCPCLGNENGGGNSSSSTGSVDLKDDSFSSVEKGSGGGLGGLGAMWGGSATSQLTEGLLAGRNGTSSSTGGGANRSSSPFSDTGSSYSESPSIYNQVPGQSSSSSSAVSGRSSSRAGTIRDDVSALGTISIYSCSEYERAVRNPNVGVGPGGSGGDDDSLESILPTWMNDKETETCCECQDVFVKKSIWSMGGFMSVTKSNSSSSNNSGRNSPYGGGDDNSTNKDMSRRHHCRRCRNVFCGACTNKKAVICLLYIDRRQGAGVKENTSNYTDQNINYNNNNNNNNNNNMKPQRVCNACFNEIPTENEYLQVYKPLLLNSGMFNSKGGFLNMAQRLTRLYLTNDGFSLVEEVGKSLSDFYTITNPSHSHFVSMGESAEECISNTNNNVDNRNLKITVIALGDIDSISMSGSSLTSITITLVDNHTSGRNSCTMNLITDIASTARLWVDGLRIACQRAKQGSLKTRVELSRRQALENLRRYEDAARRNEIMTAKRLIAKQEADTLRAKYKR